jgi:MYXO-CTERM domain-containing protein
MAFARALPILLLAPACWAGSWTYQRADGRRVELEVEQEAGRWTIPLKSRDQRIELSDQLVAVSRDPRGFDPATLAAHGLCLVKRLGGLEPLWLLRAADPPAAVRACDALTTAGQARWAVPDFWVPVDWLEVPSDPLFAQQWHLRDEAGQDIAVEGAWDLTRGDAQVVVAVVDTGVDLGHPDLDPARMAASFNVISQDPDASPSELAIDHHGTACMGLAAADMDNGAGVVGVCPECSWMAVRVFERGALMRLSALSEGITWAVDHGAWVISNSWGIGQELIDQGVDVAPIRAAVLHAVEVGRAGLGCVVLFAAGNGDSELNAQPIGPDELPAMDETLAIGGCDHTGAVAKYSDYAASLSLLAPTWSGYPDEPRITTTDTSAAGGANKGGENHQTDPSQTDVPTGKAEPDPAGDYTRYFSGTSAATPIVAGVAALVLSADPGLDWRAVRDILQSTAEPVGQNAQPPRLAAAYGPDGHDDHYGHGRVHAARAVALAWFGQDRPDGEPCRLDRNCLHVCRVADGLAGDGVCATACETATDCGSARLCDQGYCQPAPSQPDPVELVGGCSCSGRPGSGGALGLVLLFFLLAWVKPVRSFAGTRRDPMVDRDRRRATPCRRC